MKWTKILKNVETAIEKIRHNEKINPIVVAALNEIPFVGPFLSSWYNESSANKKEEQIKTLLQNIVDNNEDYFKKLVLRILQNEEQLKSCKNLIQDVEKNLEQLSLENQIKILETSLNTQKNRLENKKYHEEEKILLTEILQEIKSLESMSKTRMNSEDKRAEIKEILENIDYHKRYGMSPYLSEKEFTELRILELDSETWGCSDLEMSEKDSKISLEEIVENSKPFSILASTFGNGKTTITMKLLHDYLDIWKNANSTEYLPILVPLKLISEKEIDHDYENKSAPSFSKSKVKFEVYNFIEFLLDSQTYFKKILLILDGLDEYSGNKENLINKLESLYNQNKSLRVVITTRMETYLVRDFPILKYFRLMPLDKEKVSEYFGPDGDVLNYENLTKIGLKPDEVRKPLFCNMIKQIGTEEFKEYIQCPNRKITRGYIYRKFLHERLLMRKIEQQSHFSEFDEKRLLRKIAALKQLYKNNLERVGLEDKLKIFQIEVKDDFEVILEKVITTYFYHSYDQPKSKYKIVDFIHKSFREYLVAEYYLESILIGEKRRLNVGTMTKETIEFLLELIDYIKTGDEGDVSKFLSTFEIFNEKRSIVSFDSTSNDVNKILNDNCKKFVESNEIVVYDEVKNKPYAWEAKTDTNNFDTIWIYRWIALSVYSKLNTCENLEKHVSSLVEKTVNFVPEILKNFSKINLAGADLSGANLAGANLAGADLMGANLAGADLTGTDLTGANLIHANLSHSRLTSAKLIQARLYRANLTGSVLIHAKLTDTRLSESRLTRADLTNADLTYALILDADLVNTDLTKAIFTNADLGNSNLSGSILLDTRLIGTNLTKTTITNTNLNSAFYDLSVKPKFESNFICNENAPYYKSEINKVLNSIPTFLIDDFLEGNPKYVKISENKN